jgi:hypothetical protein
LWTKKHLANIPIWPYAFTTTAKLHQKNDAGSNMDHKNCYGFIHIGLLIRLFVNVDQHREKKNILDLLKRFNNELSDASFEVSLAYMGSSTYRQIVSRIKKLESDTSTLGPEIAEDLSDCFHTIEKIVFSESCTKKIYLLPLRRFNTDALLNSPHNLLAQGAFEKLDQIAKSDIGSASRCILFGEATACAFHILRATEAVLKQYYFHHKRQNRLAKPMWGNMLDQLKAKNRNKPPAPLLNALDVIRTSYRNPTQHPEAVYTIDSAQDLFGVCLDAIGKMSVEL